MRHGSRRLFSNDDVVADLPPKKRSGEKNSARVVTLDELEAATGRDRWSLSRDFRTFYGTSPYRYLTMRRLDDVRHQLLAGTSLVDAAATAGFADQSHMTRHFSKTFGLTPGRWLQVASGILPG
ncbi:AraC family transcriptional regulator [Pandoraea anapnoica]|uniref:AraC family transcriptional regulator n=1 Tax=Pandoraea anapnoica TaxID=2508301 RepID=A0A5E5A3G1_9BURK|nr:AraC family transcriptional regulator [Pandoraea anapnoica]